MNNKKEYLEFSEFDGYLYGQGVNYESYKKLGAHPSNRDGVDGVYFAVLAPHAKSVAVLSDTLKAPTYMQPAKGHVGVWECFIPSFKIGDVYSFNVEGADGITRKKTDPYAFLMEKRPDHQSVVVAPSTYTWHDSAYLEKVDNSMQVAHKPMAIYEVHPGSWKKDWAKDPKDGFMNYRAIAHDLVEYVKFMGYTHVEIMGICEHPFDGSWGYQVTGYFAPTSRFGSPDDLRYFVDTLHLAGIGVILDWVPVHFPKDTFSLENFDGTHLYEYEDPLRMEMPGWGTYQFDHGKNEVKSFLISSACYWINEFHFDALRVDAVAALLGNNFDRAQYRPNINGGVENLEGINFIRQLNYTVLKNTKGFLIAEDSSIFKGVTDPVEEGGLGFRFKWNLGWMNDTLRYFEKDPIYRKYHHNLLTHTYEYTFLENFVLVLSHDEVVHGKGSMINKMAGDKASQFGALKALYALQFTSPGKKLLFQGQDFGQEIEWNYMQSIDWHLADEFSHRSLLLCVQKLLNLYNKYPSLYTDAKDSRTFEWINSHDQDRNILSFIRRNPWNYNEALLVVANLSPTMVNDYASGVPTKGWYKRIFSTYDTLPNQGSSEDSSNAPLVAEEKECDGRPFRLTYNLRPYEVIVVEFPIIKEETKVEEVKTNKKIKNLEK